MYDRVIDFEEQNASLGVLNLIFEVSKEKVFESH